MSDLQIHINRAGQQYGPYPEATAREMLAAGQLLPTDLAWHPGAEGWKTLQELLGAEAAQASPAPPPPSNPAGPPKRQVAGGQPAEEKKEEPKEGEEADDPDKIHVTRKGEPIGPYPRDKAREYFIEGTLLPTDWAWHDGMGEDWKPLNEVLELPLPAGAGGGGSVSGGPWTIGGCLSEGWQKFKANLGPVILFFIISSLVLFITAVIPLVNIFVFVPVMAGYLFYFIKFSRGEPVAIGDLFSGFKRGYPQLLLVALLIGVIGFVAVLPGISVMIFSGAAFITDLMGTIQDGIAGNITDFGAELEGVFSSLKSAGVGLLAGVILMILLPLIALSFTPFSMPLVIDRQMKAVDAIIASARLMKGQWFKVVFFLILTGLISGFGQIVIIGVLITGPLAMTAWAVFYLKNAGSITAAHTAPVAKNMKIGLICGAVLPVGAAVAAVVMAGGSIMGVAGAIDSNGTSEDAGNSGGAQTVDLAKELPGVYLFGHPSNGIDDNLRPTGLPDVTVITIKEDSTFTLINPLSPQDVLDSGNWKINPDTPGQFQIDKRIPPASRETTYKLEPGLGFSKPNYTFLRVDNITGTYSFSNGTTQGRLVLKKNQNAEMWVNNQKTISSGRWFVSGGNQGTPLEVWFNGGGAMQLILSLDTNTKPFSMKSVARLTYDQATKKFTRVSLPPQGQIAYTRAKGGGGQGGGQSDGNQSPEPEE